MWHFKKESGIQLLAVETIGKRGKEIAGMVGLQ
jgi:hypothetical protein